MYADFITGTAGQMLRFLLLQPKGEALLNASREAFTSATKSVAWVAAAFVVLGLVASLRLKESDSPAEEIE